MSSLTTYEKERNARIASNQQLLQSLGLGIAMPTDPAACRARCPLRLTPPRGPPDRGVAALQKAAGKPQQPLRHKRKTASGDAGEVGGEPQVLRRSTRARARRKR